MDFVEAINRSGSDATFISLPNLGIRGNTHSAFADLNNLEIERIMEEWLASKGLDKADHPHQGPLPLKIAKPAIPLEKLCSAGGNRAECFRKGQARVAAAPPA